VFRFMSLPCLYCIIAEEVLRNVLEMLENHKEKITSWMPTLGAPSRAFRF
jgi:hypothetical protein